VHVKSFSAHAVRSLIIARKKLVGQRVTLENQIRGLAVVFGVRLPRALTAAFIDQALNASEGVAGLSAAIRGLIAARAAVMTAVAAIDADMRRMTRASDACRRLTTIPGVSQLTALAFAAAVDDPSHIRRSRDVGAYLGLVPKRYQSGEVDYLGGISKCGDRRVRTLLYEAANVMLTRYKGQLKLKDWAFAIARRSSMRKARIALGASSRHHHARDAAGRNRVRHHVARAIHGDRRPHPAPARSDARGREQTTAPILSHAANRYAPECGRRRNTTAAPGATVPEIGHETAEATISFHACGVTA